VVSGPDFPVKSGLGPQSEAVNGCLGERNSIQVARFFVQNTS